MNPWFVFFPTGNVWQHYGSPWGTGGGDISLKIIEFFFMHVKLPTMRYFQGLEVRLGWVPSSDVLRVWMAGWDFQHVFFCVKKTGWFSKGDLNFQGDKMISCWKEKHQKIILLMIYEALCSVFVILWNDFWSFSSVMFFFDIDKINVSRNLDMRCQPRSFPIGPVVVLSRGSKV